VVDVVHYEVVGGIQYLAVHFDALAVLLSDGVVCFGASFGEPFELAQVRIVFGVDDSKFSAGEGNQAGRLAFWVGGS